MAKVLTINKFCVHNYNAITEFLTVALKMLYSEPNPYMGHLAWGDAFVVTADSVSLISEACSTGYCIVYRDNNPLNLSLFLTIETII